MSESSTPESEVVLGPDANVPPETSPKVSSPAAEPDGPSLKALLAEQEGVKKVLTGFVGAIQSASFPGRDSAKIAQGLAFLEAILLQNTQHIESMKSRIKANGKG
jgi:hypothetical protein